jgi:competence protein ComGC
MQLKHSKFSLIEFLIVVSILAILMTLLSPQLRSMMHHAKRMGCAENLRGIGAAYHLYAEDEDDQVADCIFIGSTNHKSIYANDSDRSYRGAYNIGRFHNGRAGYLEPYLGKDKSEMYCPGTEFSQGVKAFGSSRFVSGVATYTSLSPFNFMVRKRNSDYIINPYTDGLNGWDNRAVRPVYLDPVFSMIAWYRNRVGQGGAWDQFGSEIHDNVGLLPILMSDGHVFNFDRAFYPKQYVTETGYTHKGTFINRIYDDL